MKRAFLPIILAALLFTGCSIVNSELETNTLTLLHQEAQLPEEMFTDHIQFSAYKALDHYDLIEYWNLFQLKGDIPEVNFDKSAVVLLGTFEPSTCPHYIEGFEQKDSDHTVAFQLKPYGDCTFDANPMSFVLKMDRDVVEKLNWVEFDREIVEIKGA
ncbi:hypothetical protein [Alkalihalophilus marmarensis]|uniref:Lipoprotein n=1 Tax=Alkalihalophilus marmarensis DSM 21297 TaxID=1188261 RepID=U6SJP6_9BACI|nr:hypothetical protein [Alkalihalophilus marmarensis]ERN51813.1 hypothetical protein A33I_18555 [Alkalihalophilus marmarensis DSM 21297]